MTDQPTNTNDTSTSTPGDETFAWSAEPEAASTSNPQAREWLAQLQGMIENLTTQAGPVIRDIGIKAAELAAIAGEKAGPVAQRAAELTGQAGQKLAERSRDLAADLRHQQAAPRDETAATSDTTPETADKPTADVA